jgi:hypothetical protein
MSKKTKYNMCLLIAGSGEVHATWLLPDAEKEVKIPRHCADKDIDGREPFW